MELIFDHVLGKQEDQDLVICRPMAIVQPEEEDDAVERGWLALDHDYKNKEVWYQSRSTRIDLRKYEPRFRKFEHNGKPLGMKTIEANEMVSLLGLPKIYRQYMKDKKFGADYDPFRFYHDRDRFLIFYIDSPDNIVGFTKQKYYKYQEDILTAQAKEENPTMLQGVESVIHANSIPISALSLDMELSWARENCVSHYYLGSGYEKSSEYKASWKGFEWWTGTEWSTDKKLYKKLCRRDSRLTLFSDVENLSHL